MKATTCGNHSNSFIDKTDILSSSLVPNENEMDKSPKKLSVWKNSEDSLNKAHEADKESQDSDSDYSLNQKNFKSSLHSRDVLIKTSSNPHSPQSGVSDEFYWGLNEEEYIGEWKETEKVEPCKSETEETPSIEGKEKSEGESSASSEALSNIYSKLSPFTIQWAFGTNPNLGLINLTTIEEFEVFFACGHYGVLFNYGTNTMTMFPGHISPITTIDCDSSGRWLITADAGEDNVIIIWDKKRKLPAWSLYNVFPGEGVSTAKISQDARFLTATNCNFNYSVKFWMWTYGRVEPDGVVNLDPAYGKPKHIDFNHKNTKQFAVTLESIVIFCEWDEKEKQIKSYIPKFEISKKKLGTFRESLFLDDGHTTLTSTSQGYVIVWCDVKYSEPIVRDNLGTIRRNFLKELKLHETGIKCLRLTESKIASSSEDGTILCHDQQLRLMYHISKLDATYFSFNIDYIPCRSDPFSEDFDSSESSSSKEKVESILEIEMSEKNYSYKELKQSEIFLKYASDCDLPYPSDYTLKRRNFRMRDFVFMTKSGKIGYLSHRRKKVKYYLYNAESPVLSMDCNPYSPHLLVGYSHGRLTLFDYYLKKILVSVEFTNPVTSLKYSHLGHYLIAGFQNGELLELHPFLLTATKKLDTLKAPISKICFSKNDILLAFFDQTSTVQVFKKKKGGKIQWVSMGKYISHYKPIVDIMFIEDTKMHNVSRLFTIGRDRMLVEYDLENLEEDKLKILSVIRVEQTAIPCCFTEYSGFSKNPQFLISNDQFKIKVFDLHHQICEKTTLGPTADTPIKFMKIINEENKLPNRAKMVYTTEKHIGLRLLPPTGNPFEGMGIVGHPEKLCAFAISFDHKYIFTVGVNDLTPFMWEVNPGSLEVASHLGGVGLEPFASLVEGGPNSFLFKEIEDFFYYSQIIHQGEDPNLDRSVAKFLALCEIPDLFRALGYYPTDYEIKNLLHELKYMNFEATGEMLAEVTFEECVKAYLNHRPVVGISSQDIKNALLLTADVTDPSDILIERSEVYKVLEEKGEPMEHAEAVGYLCILLLPKDETNPMPPCMNIDDFVEQAFGIDPSITEEHVREITHAFEKTNIN